MKAPKLLLAAFAVSISISAFSQQDAQKNQTEKKESKASTWGVYPPPALQVDSAAAQEAQSRANQQRFPAPNFGSYYIPVLGSYAAAEANTNGQIVITADEKNIGKVWIEGLTTTKVYALLKAAPGIYKIPAQKQAQEGTLIYDDGSKQVNICLGCGFKDNNPSSVIENNQATAKTKKTRATLKFTGVKTEQSTVSLYK